MCGVGVWLYAWTMRVRRIIAWIAGLLLLLLAGAALWLWTADLGRFQEPIETAITERLGRDFRAERLSLHLGRSVHLVADGVRLANPDWAPEPGLLAIRRLEADIRLSSLFDDGPIVIERARVEGLDLAMFLDADGRHSFEFDLPAEPETPPRAPGGALPVMLRDVEVLDARLALDDASRDFPIEMLLQRLAIQEDPSQRLEILLEGRINDQETRFDGALAPTRALFQGGALDIEGSGAFGTLQIEGQGVIDDLSRPDRPTATVNLSGPDIRDVERLLGLEPVKPGAYDITLDAGPAEGRWALDLDGRIGGFMIEVEGAADGLQSLDRFTLDTHMAGPNLQTLVRLFGVRDVPPEPFEFIGVIHRDDPDLEFENVSLVIGETAFDLDATLTDVPRLTDSRLSLDIAGPDIGRFRDLFGLPGIAEGPFELSAEIEPVVDGVDIVRGHVRSNLGNLELTGTLSGLDQFVGSKATVNFVGNDAKAVFDALDVPGFPPEPFELEGTLEIGEQSIALENTAIRGLLDTTIEGRGRIGFDFLSPQTNLELRLRGDDLARTVSHYDINWPLGNAPFDLSTRLRAAEEGIYLDAVSGTVGQSTLSGDALIPLRADMEGLDIAFQSRGPNLRTLLKDTVDFDVPAVDWSASARIRRDRNELQLRGLNVGIARSTVTGELTLPWPVTDGNGRLNLVGRGPELNRVLPRIGEFRTPAIPYELALEADVRNARWHFQRAHLLLERARIDVSGTFDELPDFSNTDLVIEATVPDLSKLGSWRQVDLPAVPVNLVAGLTGSTTDLTLDGVTLKVGDSTVEGRGRYATDAQRPLYELDLVSEAIDLRPVLPPPANGQAAEETEPPDGRVIPEWPLPLDELARQDAVVDVKIGRLQTHRRIVSDFELRAKLQDGALELDRYQSRGLRGGVWAEGQLIPLGDGRAALSAEIVATGLAPNREAWQNADPSTLPRIDAAGRLSATGSGLRSLAASVEGQAIGAASAGTLPGDGLAGLNLGLLDLLSGVLLPKEVRNQPTVLRCFAARLAAENGVLTTEPIAALSTERVLVLGSGSIDLGSEKLDLGFQTTPTRLLDINLAELVNPFVRIRGTLADPTPEVDPAGTLVYSGAAAATGGLSILAQGLWNRLRGSSKPCETLRDEVREEYEMSRERDSQ